MLLTGDARGDKVLLGLQNAGLLLPPRKMNVDILKLPHHGSENNVTTGFFRRIHAQHYVASGDGKNGNPERDTFEMLFKARGKADFDIHLTYKVKDIDVTRKNVANRKFRRGRRARPWNKQHDSLDVLFKEMRDSGAKFSLHEPDDRKRIAIDLRTPVDF